MEKSTYVNVQTDTVKSVIDSIIEAHPDRTLLLTPCFLKRGKAPTKKCNGYVLTVEVVVAEEVVNDLRFINDMGILVALTVPKSSLKEQWREEVTNHEP
ncbi:hypothetical protein [Desulfitobacterium chlororespirans]|uniref:Uncharacterized protein n=1 Tax=Desulfitobacterium chlororespirans DSM 11544 TaxID=1121395 RepID=A0A1M7U3U2_9FIRM|nr:hypothetical protein [Desulfitobacterium chlororespirans]SHN77563.1 hypothetical protein SAMN02745215_02904 [Desulfitobacterium chlororespirans DSM 11544]